MTPPSPYGFPTFNPVPPHSADFSFQNAGFAVSAAPNTTRQEVTPSLTRLPDIQPHHHAHPPTSFEQQPQQYIETQLHPGELAGTIDPLILFGPHDGHSAAAAFALQPDISSSAPADITRD
ncbi:hypothetical protein CCMA1212_000770 [Trichoderma ghanense]|uniref:Uncharacterized protein n=1 Tax=Trichoderma ghanense TaxID=65468 RepID=A0ABY2HFZ5_9HYPO